MKHIKRVDESYSISEAFAELNRPVQSKNTNRGHNESKSSKMRLGESKTISKIDLKKIVKLVKQYICSTYSCADLQIDTKDSTMFVEIWTEDSEYDDYDYDDIYSDSPDFTARLDIEKLIKLKDNIDEFETYVEDSISGYTVDSTEEDFYDRAAEELESYFNCSGAFLEPSTQLGRGRTFLFADDMKFEGSFDFQAGESYIKSNNFEGFLELCKDSFTVVTEESLTEAAKITTKSMHENNSSHWLNIQNQIALEHQDGINPFYDESTAGDYVLELMGDVENELDVSVVPSVQGGHGDVYIHLGDRHANSGYPIGPIDFTEFSNQMIDLILEADSENDFINDYTENILAYIE